MFLLLRMKTMNLCKCNEIEIVYGNDGMEFGSIKFISDPEYHPFELADKNCEILLFGEMEYPGEIIQLFIAQRDTLYPNSSVAIYSNVQEHIDIWPKDQDIICGACDRIILTHEQAEDITLINNFTAVKKYLVKLGFVIMLEGERSEL